MVGRLLSAYEAVSDPLWLTVAPVSGIGSVLVVAPDELSMTQSWLLVNPLNTLLCFGCR